MNRLGASVVAALIIGSCFSASAVDVTLGANKDNTLFEDNAGALSNGAGDYTFAGRVGPGGGGGKIRRALISFDLSSIPSGATVTSVGLILNMSKTIAGPETTALHRVTASWGEGTSDAAGDEGAGAASTTGDATWLHRSFNTSNWTAQGGDFAVGASASVSVGAEGFYIWGTTAQMVADVQAWVATPANNFGWIMIGNESVTTTAKRFDSRTNLIPGNRPALTVRYTPPSSVDNWMLY
jgi:hypothetical protein